MNKLIVLFLVLTSITAPAQALSDSQTPALKAPQNTPVSDNVSPQEAAKMLTDKKAIIIDVREDNEWNLQHIPDALHIPLGQLKARMTELEPYKASPIITQCHSGRRSKEALVVLKLAGFSTAYNLNGGIVSWTKAGLKVE